MNVPTNDVEFPERPDPSDRQQPTGQPERSVNSYFTYDASNRAPLRPTVTFFEYDPPPPNHWPKPMP